MTLWQRLVHRPQALWARRAAFQIHLWAGIGVGLYAAVISLTGSAIVFRRELSRRRVTQVEARGRVRMSAEELRPRVSRAYPDYDVISIGEPENPQRPDPVALERGGKRVLRLFDPYTGADLGDPRTGLDRGLGFLTDLHDNLLAGIEGRIVNGFGALLVTLLGLTGAVLWWPGASHWRRSMTVDRRWRWKRMNWGLHSTVGFWSSAFVFIWGISGIYLCLPGSLRFLIGPEARVWLTRLHFGRFNGVTEAAWTVLGLAPAALAFTGALMWWNRVASKKLKRV